LGLLVNELKVGKKFRDKSECINTVKQWHIKNLLQYKVHHSTKTYVQLHCVQGPVCRWYLHGGYHQRFNSEEVSKLKGSHTYRNPLVLQRYCQIDSDLIVEAMLTIVITRVQHHGDHPSRLGLSR
jgi:hypothetical protein